MFRTAKKWALAVALLGLLQVTFVCDAEALEDFFDDLGVEVYYDRHYGCDDCYHSGCWSDCDDDWSFDFDWWW
jgi:hypothetical protein